MLPLAPSVTMFNVSEKNEIFINIKNVDRIYYIEDGKIIESGKHIDLMNKKVHTMNFIM